MTTKSYSEQRVEDAFHLHVLFREQHVFDSEKLAADLGRDYPSVGEWSGAGHLSDTGLITVRDGADSYFIPLLGLGAAVPAEHYATAVSRALHFPGAQDALGCHTNHLSFWVKSKDLSLASRFRAARIVTCLGAAFAKQPSCVAILFPSGDVIASPEAWGRAAAQAVNEEWPLDSWFSYHVSGHAPPSEGAHPFVSCGSVGMAAFNGHEIAFPAAPVAPGDAVAQVMGAIYLLLAGGNAFNDGDTIGFDEHDHAYRIRYAPEGHLGAQTNTWFILHPQCALDEEASFPLSQSVPPPPGVDNTVKAKPGFLSRLLRGFSKPH